jgi:hypothetical protein
MDLRTRPVMTLALLVSLGASLAPLASGALSAQAVELRALDGEWIFVEDRTEGRPLDQQQPSMSARVRLRVEKDALILVRRDGELRIALDGSPTDVTSQGTVTRYRGEWKDGAFKYQSERLGIPRSAPIRWELRPTAEGLLARVDIDPPTEFKSLALYRHPQDIALPTPSKAAVGDLAWLSGAWVGARGTGGAISIEERWSPPLGGAMLAVSRTVSRGKMSSFEFLRVIERDGGLVYVAQPQGAPPTEFVLTELAGKRAVFENPRHDSPQRIVYELSDDGRLSASIGFIKGGRPQRFEFKRESN